MYVVLTYDVNEKRVQKALKVCRKYLVHVQKSVFEGNITEAKLKKLKKELSKFIKPKEDSVSIYIMKSTRDCMKECIGKVVEQEEILKACKN